jgi:hypothetical protein
MLGDATNLKSCNMIEIILVNAQNMTAVYLEAFNVYYQRIMEDTRLLEARDHSRPELAASLE